MEEDTEGGGGGRKRSRENEGGTTKSASGNSERNRHLRQSENRQSWQRNRDGQRGADAGQAQGVSSSL